MPLIAAVAAVHDGYVLGKSCVRSSMGGAMLTRCMLSATQTLQGHQRAEVRPRYSLKRVENAAGAYEVSTASAHERIERCMSGQTTGC